MPTCLKCGRDLTKREIKARNWKRISNKTYYRCDKCGATWLYAKAFNCPVLLDAEAIASE